MSFTVPVVEVKLISPPGYALFGLQTIPLSALVDDGTYAEGWRVTLPDGSVRQVLRGGRFTKWIESRRGWGWGPRRFEQAYTLAKRIRTRLAYAHMKSGVRKWSMPVKPDRDSDFYRSPSLCASMATGSWNSSKCLDEAMSPLFRLVVKRNVYFRAACHVVATDGMLHATYDPDRRWAPEWNKPTEHDRLLEALVCAGMWTPAEAVPV